MHSYTQYFQNRAENDRLDVVPLLLEGFIRGGDDTLLEFNGRKSSFQDMARLVARMQKWLELQGVRQGDRVALMLENGLEHMALIYALMLNGAVWLPVNTRLKGPGISYLLEHAKPVMFVIQPSFADAMAGMEMPPVRTCWLNEINLPEIEASARPESADIQPQDTLCLIYTSGTTGAPKGVVFTHRMMRIASEGALLVSGVRSGDRMFAWEPLCHIGGAQLLLVPFLEKVSLHVVERFSASRFWDQVQKSQASHLHYLGGILDILCQQPPEAMPSEHSLRTAWGAGVAAKSWNDIKAKLGVEIRECYGMTEGASFTTVNGSGKVGSIGKPLPWLSVELLGPHGEPVPTGELGQIVVSTDVEGCFLPGYLDNPEASAAALRDGKLHTGDMARADEQGDFYFVGRQTDSMRVRGENVSAWEIERVFAMHPSIAAVAAIGIASDIGEQEIMLYVQFKDGMQQSFASLVTWAKPLLASFQLPRYYRHAEQFEKTLSERIRKHLLDRNVGDAWDRTALTS